MINGMLKLYDENTIKIVRPKKIRRKITKLTLQTEVANEKSLLSTSSREESTIINSPLILYSNDLVFSRIDSVQKIKFQNVWRVNIRFVRSWSDIMSVPNNFYFFPSFSVYSRGAMGKDAWQNCGE